ncbi:subtilisin-like protease SBT4.4 [Ziziphus jujuba]|uniref:Subtilisin-like protease SBT4.4 n=1 Tax=Ziziphus jujuba TaxID=326968 RepID=A0ABM3IBG2_ZIZJJ|nr:subtilisin-like protease SBT4.4 [Ziziphus jujuba]
MAKCGSLMFYHLLISIFMLSMILMCKAIENGDRKEYIVYMGSLPDDVMYSPTANQISLLQGVLQGSSVEKSLTRSYRRSFNGFAAKLTDTERQRLAEMKGVVSVFPSKILKLQTTRSWDFIGLNNKAKRNATAESDVIIGVLDTGVWPESDSFNDEGFGPPPERWKGVCNGGANFTCNNKIIGARSYESSAVGDRSVRDTEGHGTHTASTAAGNAVNDASFFGIAEGTAKGAVPSARIAVYKVCSEEGCSTAGILSGFDDAIADGVDIITISIGGEGSVDYDEDSIAIGAFHGLKKGVLTVQSAGNSGPAARTVTSVAPWVVSVAASSTDRRIVSKVVLGNGDTLLGNTVNGFSLNGTSLPLVYGAQTSNGDCPKNEARLCSTFCLNPTAVRGKILLCDRKPDGDLAGAAGVIYSKTSAVDTPFVEPYPSSGLTSKDFTAVQAYHDSTTNPEAEILKSDSVIDSAAPKVASFSSRGPNDITPDILKPDISAPGIDILAAYSPASSPSSSPDDARRVNYNIVSGTSMACPHVAGAAAYVKTFHPNWSPSAIKSALMTTASVMNGTKSSDSEFGYGAGQVNPVEALDPGLVYESSEADYINFLCGIGYTEERIRLISGDSNSTCPEATTEPKDLNYPSLAFTTSGSFTVEFHRRVKNVGLANSTYEVKVTGRSELDIQVAPEVLSFKSQNEEKTFSVTVKGSVADGTTLSSSITWSDGTHSVRSPIVIFN